jgi:hypothetical protein
MGRLVDTAELSVVPADDAPPTRAQANNFGDLGNGVGLALLAQESAYVGLAHAVSYRRGIDDSLGLAPSNGHQLAYCKYLFFAT